MQIIEDVVILEAGPQKSQAATKKKHFWNNWGVIGGGDSKVSNTKKPETASKEKSDWNVIAPVTRDTLSKQPETDFEDKKQPDLEEIKVDGAFTGIYHCFLLSNLNLNELFFWHYSFARKHCNEIMR